MNILIFAAHYLDLCRPIIEELQKQGHVVSVIKDYYDSDDPRMLDVRIKISEKRIERWRQRMNSFWKNQESIIARKHDIFISINGMSINETAFQLIDKYSPGIIKVMYVWDPFSFYDFRQLEKYFDKLYSFDILDARTPGWELLPSFYSNNTTNKPVEPDEFDVFMIGGNHDMRYSFVRKILPSLKGYRLSYYIKLLSQPLSWKSMSFMVDCIKSLYIRDYYMEVLFKYGFENNELMIHKGIALDEYMNIMRRSKCILDNNKPRQAGLSPRFIRAMALNKKVITTNKWACRYSFVNEKNVLVVDKDKPVIDVDFIKSETCPPKPSNLDYLELSTWVRILIGEIECPFFEKQNNPS